MGLIITRRSMSKTMLTAAMAGSAGIIFPDSALAVGEDIILFPIQPPNVGFGTTNTYPFKLVGRNGVGLGSKLVRVWFSGQHAIQTGQWSQRTNSKGEVAFTLTAPRWQGKSGWIDLNAACTDGGVAVQKIWKIKK